ncbi:hypothetical protein GJ688_15085 [Heliobacillus mobilis]|uniref:YcdB/YcdC repeated domain-containing protein n=1 Tax=Heliobacterium mobile TaxID=28064 RepID=A0A6I3SMS1_HELMO|nr:YcdB/YcdC domain-containing protein [Heliobacterium mobile]MTV50293.1 hypothetical protein [Heliobacterium mobile]
MREIGPFRSMAIPMKETLSRITLALLLTPSMLSVPVDGDTPIAEAASVSTSTADAGPSILLFENQPYPEVVTKSDATLKTLMSLDHDLSRMKVTGKQLELLDGTFGYWDPDGHKTLWHINLSGPQAENHGFATATFDGQKGNLIRFNWHDDTWTSEDYPSKDFAIAQATTFLRLVAGEEYKQFSLGDSDFISYSLSGDGRGNDKKYHFRTVQFQRLVKGIPVLNSGWTIDVDANGHIINANNIGPLIVDESIFPAAVDLKTAEEIKNSADKWLKLRLIYNPDGTESIFSPSAKARLVYAVDSYLIDAKTGEGISSSVPSREIITIHGNGESLIRNKEDAARFMEKVVQLDVDRMELHIDSAPGDTSTGPQTTYNWMMNTTDATSLTRTSSGPSNIRSLTLAVNSETGKVNNFYCAVDRNEGKKEPKITVAQAQETLITFLASTLEKGEYEMEIHRYVPEKIPDWVDRSKLPQDVLNSNTDYTFSVNRLYQGVPDWRPYSLTIDGETGKLSSFYGQVAQLKDHPDPSKAIIPVQAKTAFLKQSDLQLIYEWPEFYGQRSPRAYLRYIIAKPLAIRQIDAITGEVVTLK